MLAPGQWRARRPAYPAVIEPRADEAVFPKPARNGFQATNADYYLRTWRIDTLVAVGFALRSGLFHACMGARHRNYRVIVLWDCMDPADHEIGRAHV
jgi:nicotinamidase-related amidase